MPIKKDTLPGDGTPDPVVEAAATTTETTHTETTTAETTTAETTAADPLTAEAPAGETAAEAVASEAVEHRSSTTIRNHVLLAAATAAIPVNFLDTAALAAVQLNMLRELSKAHGVEFRADIGKSAVGTLLMTVAPTALTGGVLGSIALRMALRSVPLVGTAVNLLTQPAFNAAFTYALGKVFHQHFVSGGTFLTFEPEKVTSHFRRKFEEARGKGVAENAAAA